MVADMRLFLAVLFAVQAMPAFAEILGRHDIQGVPAPLIGAGLPIAIIVGGAWVGYRALKRRRRRTARE